MTFLFIVFQAQKLNFCHFSKSHGQERERVKKWSGREDLTEVGIVWTSPTIIFIRYSALQTAVTANNNNKIKNKNKPLISASGTMI